MFTAAFYKVMKSTVVVLGLMVYGGLPNICSADNTDSFMQADSSQSGYLPNHNIDPSILTSGSFGQIWQFKSQVPAGSAQDQFYAKPLVYTPKSLGRQLVLAFSEANRIYAVDAVNGSLVTSRDLGLEGETPFQVSDLEACNDIGQTIGITGTPVVDPTTDTVYFWAKSYVTSGQQGMQNGAYRFHAIDAATLAERPGFPTNIQGAMADNDNSRWFTGGNVLQRTGLNLINGFVYAGFGAHCDLFNYTGWVVGMSTTGTYLSGYVTSGGPSALPQDGTWKGGGGAAGIWQAGSAIASDNSGRLFFATGNGVGPMVNNQQSASGRIHLDTLSECMASLAISSTGALTQQDYFQPSGYQSMDAGDRDLGSGGVSLPDPSVFSGGGVNRIAITCGKNGQCYVTNADNLGGYKNGAGGTDAVLQIITPPNGYAIFGNVGAYPLEGGYIYITPVNSPTYVYSLGFDNNQRPAFTLVAQTDDLSPGAVGVGSAIITTLNNKPGTGILWIVDTNGVRAYNAVPQNGKMIKVNLPASTNPSKFQHPVFGNGRYYLTNLKGQIFAYGSPVALPLNCTSLLDFGTVAIGTASTQNVTCVANININRVQGLVIEQAIYTASNASLPQGALNPGDTFAIPVTLNLTGYILNSGSSSAPSVAPGVQTTAMNLFLDNGVTGYTKEMGVTLTATCASTSPWLSLKPLQVNFPGLVVGSNSPEAGSASTIVIQNTGQSTMTILGYAFSSDKDGPYTNVTKSSSGIYTLDANNYFTSADLLPIKSTVPAGASTTVNIDFLAPISGNFFTILTVFSNGGSAYVILSGSAASGPVALLEASTNGAEWSPISDCPDPSKECTVQINMGTVTSVNSITTILRFNNNGGSALTITKSKPPIGGVLAAANPSGDFSEGLEIQPGANSQATIVFQPPPAILNSDPIVYSAIWTLNTDDLKFGIHALNFVGTLAAPRVGPLLSNGSAQFKWLGCYQDSQSARIEPTSSYSAKNMSNGLCQQTALANGVVFAGTEYSSQCWTGSAIPNPSLKAADSKCAGSYNCSGDATQNCGGYGTFISLYYDTLRYSPGNGTLNSASSIPSASTQSNAPRFGGASHDDESTQGDEE